MSTLAVTLLHATYDDPCPTVVREATACGLPVVNAASGGTPGLAGAETGNRELFEELRRG